jgi:hypothetical protein
MYAKSRSWSEANGEEGRGQIERKNCNFLGHMCLGVSEIIAIAVENNVLFVWAILFLIDPT